MKRAVLSGMLACAWGCAGGSMTITGNRLNYPVSASRAIYDNAHTPLGPTNLEQLHHFEWRRTNWTILWSAIDITPDEWDLSDEINALVARYGGEGVVDLSVDISNCALSYVPFLTVLPFWPSCADVVVQGVVVRRPVGRQPPATPLPSMTVSQTDGAPAALARSSP